MRPPLPPRGPSTTGKKEALSDPEGTADGTGGCAHSIGPCLEAVRASYVSHWNSSREVSTDPPEGKLLERRLPFCLPHRPGPPFESLSAPMGMARLAVGVRLTYVVCLLKYSDISQVGEMPYVI